MKTHKLLFNLLILIVIVSSVFMTSAAPGDTFTDATIVTLNQVYNGTMIQYNDVQFYNFSGSVHRSYNFTFWQEDANYLPMYLFDSSGVQLASNFTSPYDFHTLIWSGESEYVIGIYSSEFADFPASFSFMVTEVIGEPGKSVSSSKSVSEGTFSGVFEKSLDEYWFNFSAKSDYLYQIEMSVAVGNFSAFYIYDQHLGLLEYKYDDSGLHSFNVTGQGLYVLRAVADFEFMVFPNEFKITITDITPISTPISSTDNTTPTSSTTEPESSSTTSTSQTSPSTSTQSQASTTSETGSENTRQESQLFDENSLNFNFFFYFPIPFYCLYRIRLQKNSSSNA